MAQVFISYRREDSHDVTGRIYDRLVEYFSPAGVFKDIDDIPLGSDFREVLDEAIDRARVVLVIIGPTWVASADPGGRRRLDSPADFVRLEVQTALEKGLPVIPVLVGRASMPAPDELPDSLKQLPFRNGLAVRPDPDFNHDMERLASALGRWIARPPSSRRPTVNQALDDIAREREVERIDREWAAERERYMIMVMAGQTIVDGQPTGGYPVRDVPTQASSIVGGMVAAVTGTLIALFVGSIFGGLFALPAVIVAIIGVGASVHAYGKATRYEEAESAYRRRRAIALGNGEDDGIGPGGVGTWGGQQEST